jgi:hypothetical protein
MEITFVTYDQYFPGRIDNEITIFLIPASIGVKGRVHSFNLI